MSSRSILFVFAFVLFGCAQTSEFQPPGGEDAGVDAGDPDAEQIQPGGPQVVRVVPETVDVEIVNGVTTGKNTSFTAEEKQADGTWVPTNACVWSLENVDFGTLTASTFQPSGATGGETEVRCWLGKNYGASHITVRLKDTTNTLLDDPTLTTLTQTKATDPQIAALLYPYDQTVFPRGLAIAPEMMWTGPSASDIYAEVITSKYMSFTGVFQTTLPARYTIAIAEWTKLLASNPGLQVTSTLYRLAGGKGGTAYKGPAQTWTLSRSSLKGTVDYWRVSDRDTGEIVKMPIGKPAAPFLKSSSNCTGCHAVSRDGSVVAAAYTSSGYPGGYNGYTGTASFESSSSQSGYRAVSPDGSVIAWVPCGGSNNYLGEPVELADAKTGAKITSSGLETFGLTSTPAFSPDATMMAFGLRRTPYTGSQHNIFRNSDIAVADYNNSTHKASNLRKVVLTSNNDALVFPTFTPDGSRILYQRGNEVRARNADVSNMGSDFAWTSGLVSKSDLWIANNDGKNSVMLANATSSGLPTSEHHRSFHPIMSPVAQGGYFWVVFTSLRTYGNRLTTTDDFDWNHCYSSNLSDCRHKQIWIAAIDLNAPDGVDPSHPAFWLPGQDAALENFDAYWALDQCKKTGDTCELGFECCDGSCRQENGKRVCGKRDGCGNSGDTCTTTADCCGGGQCIGGVCDTQVK